MSETAATVFLTTAKGQYAHDAKGFCGAINRARANGNVVEVPREYALANLVPCTRCLPYGEWRAFRRWAA